MSGPETKESRGGVRADYGVAYGLIAGAALGSLLMALTGEVMWVIFMPGIGLIVGSAVVAMRSRRGDHDADVPGGTSDDDATTA